MPEIKIKLSKKKQLYKEKTFLLCFFLILSVFFVRSGCTANLITNGDFSSGNTDFSSSYNYVTGADSAFPEGTYSVVTQADDVHNSWTSAWDHTSGDVAGKYFVANSSPDTNKVVWQSSSPVSITQVNTNYRFEIWISTLFAVGPGSPGPELQFQLGDGTTWINMGDSITFANGALVGAWNKSFADGKFNTTGTYYVRLLNNQSAAGGNDLGLDDVSFGIDPAGNGATHDTSQLESAASSPEDDTVEVDETDDTPVPPAPSVVPPAPSVVLRGASPANGASDVLIDTNIVLTFSDAIYAGAGNVIIKKSSDNSVVDIVNVAGGRITGLGTKTVTIDPSDWLLPNSRYYIIIDATAFDNADGLSYSGMSSNTALTFRTGATMPNPLDDKDVVAGVEAQVDIATRFMQHSTYAVLERTEWLRRHRGNSKLSNQGVQLTFMDPDMSKLASLFSLAKYLNPSADALPDGWAVWSSGSVSIGKIDETGTASLLDLESNGISIGIDKTFTNEHLLGVAVRIGNDDVTVGDNNSSVRTDGYSLSMYGTYFYNEHMFIDSVMGISRLDIENIRLHETGQLTGDRDGDQVFGSVTFGYEFDNPVLNLTSYGRVDAGYTSLAQYSESGTKAALSYDKQELINSMLSIGVVADRNFIITFGTFRPNVRLEYGLNTSQSSDADMWYVSYPSTSYTLLVDSDASSNFRGGVGVDLAMNNGLSFGFGYERTQAINSGYLDTARLKAAYILNSNIDVSLAMDNDFSSGVSLRLDCNFLLGRNWIFNTGYDREQNTDLPISNIFNVLISRKF